MEEPLHESPVQRPPPPPPPPQPASEEETGIMESHPVDAYEDEEAAAEEAHRQLPAGPAIVPQPVAPAAITV